MNFNQIKNVYFIGIGGIGMSALARYFLTQSKNIAGYDRSKTTLTESLTKEGMHIHYEDNPALIPSTFQNVQNTIIVYTPAIPDNHSEFIFFKEKGFKIFKRSEILGTITDSQSAVAVAGTHGKTTTTTLIAHLLNHSTNRVNAFLGGISKNYYTNYLLSKESKWVVIEADEYDRSFLHLTPQIAVVTSMDADHLDIYGTREEIVKAFNQFIRQIRPNGILIYNNKIKDEIEFPSYVNAYSYSLDKDADYFARGISIENGKFLFEIKTPQGIIRDMELNIPGRINIENTVAAVSVAHQYGLDGEIIRKALSSFAGVQRRFDYQINTKNIVLIDDYAHHPKELEACILSIKEMYQNKKVTGIFQPHLFSRTRDFAEEFAKSLDLLDEVILLDIYPAREAPIPGVTSEIIFNKMKLHQKQLCNWQELSRIIEKNDFEVVIMMGAGDIDKLVEPVKKILLKKSQSIK